MKRNEPEYDAIVVGSGAGGGMAAYVLTARGLSVLLLEAGRFYDPTVETPMFQVEADAPLNGAATPDKEDGFYSATIDGGFHVPGEPYTVAQGSQVLWWRARMLGGRTNHYGRTTLRYGPYDFRTHSRLGLGSDWPLSYEELAPYYDRVEQLIGVFGDTEGIENSPDSPAGILLPPPPLRVHEYWVQQVLQKQFGIRTVPNHAAMLTRPHQGRPACFYATSCDRGCSIRANFQTPTVLLPPALATKRLTLRTHAMAYEVALDAHGLARGVLYIDTGTGERHLARGRAVVLAASTCETARLLLNSKSPAFPEGLANSSGQVGRNLTNTTLTAISGTIPALQGLAPFNDDGVTIGHAYVPWWGHSEQRAGGLKFGTEYHIQIIGGRPMPMVEHFTKLPEEEGRPLYGRKLRQRLRYEFGSHLELLAVGGMIPNPESRCEIDRNTKDRWGIPVLRFHWKWGEQELAQMRHAERVFGDMITAMGGTPRVTDEGESSAQPGVVALYHEAGTACMGANRKDSVLKADGHTWDVRNLYVADGASFTGHADKNPTHTIMALSWRASDHLADSLLRKEI